MVGLTACHSAPNPGSTGYYAASYRVRWLGASPGWGKWETDEDDGGAGSDRDPVDMVELTIARCSGGRRMRSAAPNASQYYILKTRLIA